MFLRRALLVLTALVAVFVLSSCGGGGFGGTSGAQSGIYLVDSGNNRIVWLSDMNATFFSSFGPALTGVTSMYNGAIGQDRRVYVIDSTNDSIVRFDNIAASNRVEVGGHGTGVGQFLNPVRVATDFQGKVYVVDRDQNKLIRFTINPSTWTTLDLSTWFASGDEPAITTDVVGHIFLAGGSTIVRLNGMTAVGALTFGSSGSGVGEFGSLNGIALDDQGRIYTADGTNNRIARINDMTGTGWVTFGSTGAGTGQFDIAFGVGVDHSGKIYVGDRNNHRLVRVDNMTGANWTVLTGVPGAAFSFPLDVFPHLPSF